MAAIEQYGASTLHWIGQVPSRKFVL